LKEAKNSIATTLFLFIFQTVIKYCLLIIIRFNKKEDENKKLKNFNLNEKKRRIPKKLKEKYGTQVMSCLLFSPDHSLTLAKFKKKKRSTLKYDISLLLLVTLSKINLKKKLPRD
jgi:hypothetical protein